MAKTDRFILSDDEPDDYNRLDVGLSPLLPIALDFISQYDSINSILCQLNNIAHTVQGLILIVWLV